MAGLSMGYDSTYWHRYLLARRHVFLVVGLVLIGLSLVFTFTGIALIKYKWIQPQSWQQIEKRGHFVDGPSRRSGKSIPVILSREGRVAR